MCVEMTLFSASAAADVKPDTFEPVCQYCPDYYWRFVWYLPYFAGERPRWSASASHAFTCRIALSTVFFT